MNDGKMLIAIAPLKCVRVIGAAFALIALAAGIGRAQIVDCSATGAGYTVFLSEMQFTPNAATAANDRLIFLQLLQFELDQQRDNRWVRSPATDVRFVLCPGRSPSMDGNDFVASDGRAKSLVESLYNRRVLLEMWGLLRTEQMTGRPEHRTAQVNFLLVPMQYATNQNEPAPAALQRLRYPEGQAQPAETFIDLISRPQDIDAFVASALGFKLLREKKYGLAHANLCRANALLQTIESRPLGTRTLEALVRLRTFVLESAKTAVAGSGATDIQRLQDPTRPCAGEN